MEIDSECFINSDQPIEIIDEDIVVTTASKSKDQIRTLASKNIPVASVLTRTAIPKRNISIGKFLFEVITHLAIANFICHSKSTLFQLKLN